MISVNTHTIGGAVCGPVQRGKLPLPWMLVQVKTICQLWDAKGNLTHAHLLERVVVQGTINIAALHPKLYDGLEVVVVGQGAPATAVMADSSLRGRVTLAHQFQIFQPKE